MFDNIMLFGRENIILWEELHKQGYLNSNGRNDDYEWPEYKMKRIKEDEIINLYQMLLIAKSAVAFHNYYKYGSIKSEPMPISTIPDEKLNKIVPINTVSKNFLYSYVKPIIFTSILNRCPVSKKDIDLTHKIIEYVICGSKRKEIKNNILKHIRKEYGRRNDILEKFNNWENCVRQEISVVLNLLEMSATDKNPIVTTDYNFIILKHYMPYISINETMNAYALVRLSCEQVIGELPVLNTFNELSKLKKNNKSDIKRLREVLSEFEIRLQTNSSKIVVNEILNDVNLAARDLNRNNVITKVSKWVKIFAIPISVLEVLQELSPIYGLGIELIMMLSEIPVVSNNNKNNWIHVVR